MVILTKPAEERVVACRFCGDTEGIVRRGYTKGGNQRYGCKVCDRTFCFEPRTNARPPEFIDTVLSAYTERSSMRGLARTFHVSRRSVARWLEKKSG